MVRYGAILKALKKAIRVMKPKDRVKARYFVPMVSEAMGLPINAIQISMSLSKLRENGYGARISIPAESDDWEIQPKVVML